MKMQLLVLLLLITINNAFAQLDSLSITEKINKLNTQVSNLNDAINSIQISNCKFQIIC